MTLYRYRRVIAGVLLVAFAVAASGLPLSVPKLAEQTEERYPCENNPCGCNSAEVCWKKCCCYSLQERLEWAAREGVTPPDHALQSAAAKGLDVTLWRPEITVTCKPQEPSVAPSTDTKPSCCCCCRVDTGNALEKDSASESLPDVSAWQAASCQGVRIWWLVFSQATIPPVAESLASSLTSDWMKPAPTLLVDSLAITPPTPPPQRLACNTPHSVCFGISQ